jgi:hypothetical protein
MATSVHRPGLLALAVLLLLCATPATAGFTYTEPPWSNEFWADKIVDDEAAASVAARRAEAGGYRYGCARLWLAMACPLPPGKGVNGSSLVDGKRSYDLELDHFEEGLRQCAVPQVPDDPYLRRSYPVETTIGIWCCICCMWC